MKGSSDETDDERDRKPTKGSSDETDGERDKKPTKGSGDETDDERVCRCGGKAMRFAVNEFAMYVFTADILAAGEKL
mgnify:CR=1 FL=1